MKRSRLNPVSAKRRARAVPLQKNAEGKDCTLRLDGCRYDTAYTVLCHIRRFGWAGVGQKPHDLLGVFACDNCHAKQERHDPDCTDEDLLRALGETLLVQLRDGVLQVSTATSRALAWQSPEGLE